MDERTTFDEERGEKGKFLKETWDDKRKLCQLSSSFLLPRRVHHTSLHSSMLYANEHNQAISIIIVFILMQYSPTMRNPFFHLKTLFSWIDNVNLWSINKLSLSNITICYDNNIFFIILPSRKTKKKKWENLHNI